MRQKGIFITGTDTGVGKTLVTGLLGRFLLENGVDVTTQKWVQTGCAGVSDDIREHFRLMKVDEDEAYIPDMAPYVFEFPASPHLAALIEKKAIEAEKIKDSFERLRDCFDVVLIEGSGGPMVPLGEEKVIADMAEELGLPVLIVAGNKLGAINHTLLAIEVLRGKGLEIIGAVFNQTQRGENKLILEDNPKIINKLTGVEILGELPFSGEEEALYDAFRPAARKILDYLGGGSGFKREKSDYE